MIISLQVYITQMCIMHEAMEQLASNIACKVCGEKVVGWASIEEEGWGVVGERDGGGVVL